MKCLNLLLYGMAVFFSASLVAQQDDEEDKTKIRFNYELSVVYDDNIRRAQDDKDIRDDSIIGLSLGIKSITHLSNYTLLVLAAKLEDEKYDVFEELDNIKFNTSLKYQFAFASKFSSPLYALKISLGGIDSNSEMRTSNTASIGFDINKWLSSTIHMTAAYTFKTRDSQSEVFDIEENLYMVNFDVDLSPRQLIYFTYHYNDGDIVSSATPTIDIVNVANVIEPDDAFGGITNNQFAYQIDAQSHVFTMGYNAALSRSLSLDLSFRFIDSEATDSASIYYERQIVRASLLGRF